MTREEALNQYYYEVALFEQWGAINIITFEEWLDVKGIKLNQD